MLVEQEYQVHRLGELGPTRVLRVVAEASILGIELLAELGASLVDEGGRERGLASIARASQLAADNLGQAGGGFLHLGPLFVPGLGDPVQDGQKTRESLAIARGKVSRSIEGAAVGQEEHRHRPAAAC